MCGAWLISVWRLQDNGEVERRKRGQKGERSREECGARRRLGTEDRF
jgi:hypothetical protein